MNCIVNMGIYCVESIDNVTNLMVLSMQIIFLLYSVNQWLMQNGLWHHSKECVGQINFSTNIRICFFFYGDIFMNDAIVVVGKLADWLEIIKSMIVLVYTYRWGISVPR